MKGQIRIYQQGSGIKPNNHFSVDYGCVEMRILLKMAQVEKKLLEEQEKKNERRNN